MRVVASSAQARSKSYAAVASFKIPKQPMHAQCCTNLLETIVCVLHTLYARIRYLAQLAATALCCAAATASPG
jgi:hypothetical protein